MRFILPRLFGLALIAGIASFLLAFLAKALMALAIVGTIVYFVMSRFGRRHRHSRQGFDQRTDLYGRPDHRYMGGAPYGYNGFSSNGFDSRDEVTPVYQSRRAEGIIPIN